MRKEDLTRIYVDAYTSARIVDRDQMRNLARKGFIKNVIYNDPATIVFWSDGTKTVVKAKDEPFDPEKGLAMAIAKKALGNEGNYYNVFKKWLPKEDSSEKIRDRTCYKIAEERFNKILDKITKEAFRGF